MVRISLFGSVDATVDGAPVDIGPARCRTVLAALALSAGSAVGVSRLVDLVWGETPPRTAEKTLQSYVVRLRKGLGPDVIVRIGAAYRLAGRIAAAGHGGQTLVSAVTAALLDRAGLRDLGTMRLDGDGPGTSGVFQLGGGEHPPLRTENGNVPVRPGRLIGRDGDLDTVADALARSPVVTLVGPGGIGKTRLAIAAAHRSAGERGGGSWIVELAAVASSGDVPRLVADTLEATQSRDRSVVESIVATLRARPVLLVLDNCEHVIDGAAGLARVIAERCPGARVLATSREALGVEGEQLVAVAPLDPAGPGAQLFDERARAVSATFDPLAHRPAVEEICRRLDGIPLAIELAAARVRTLAPPTWWNGCAVRTGWVIASGS